MADNTAAQDSLKKLINEAKVERIVFVDDDFDCKDEGRSVEIYSVIAKLSAYGEADSNYPIESLREVCNQVGLYIFDPVDESLRDTSALSEIVRNSWSSLTENNREMVLNELGIEDTTDSTELVLGQINKMMGDIVAVEEMSVARWLEEKESLLYEECDDSPMFTLVFFDRNLKYIDSHKLGWRSDFGGDYLAKEVLDSKNERLLPGILTSSVSSAEEEICITETMFQNQVFAPVIGKYRSEHLASFLEGLKLFLAINALRETKEIVLESYRSVENAIDVFESNITYSVLFGMVNASETEGGFAGNYLKRMIASYHREQYEIAIRNSYRSSRKAQLLEPLLGGSLSDIFKCEEDTKQNIVAQEAYITKEILAEGRFPIDIGDVFKLQSRSVSGEIENHYYILLTQACGLAVRSNGMRKSSAEPFLLALVKIEYGKPNSGSVTAGRIHKNLPALYRKEYKNGYGFYIDFGDILYLPDYLIDLCAFNCDGRAEAVKGACLSEGPIEYGWHERGAILNRKVCEICDLLDDYSTVINHICEQDQSDYLLSCMRSHLFGFGNVNITCESVDSGYVLGIERIARLKSDYSQGVLINYARYQSRPAFPDNIVK